jgi:hypothetical protein
MGYGGGGGGQDNSAAMLEMLTPTEGVDFNAYIARVLASVKQNWYAVMPESARLGDRGKVVLQFRIMRNGVVPEAGARHGRQLRERSPGSRRGVLDPRFDPVRTAAVRLQRPLYRASVHFPV